MKNKKHTIPKKFLAVIMALVFSASGMMTSAPRVLAVKTVPTILNYQGVLKDSGGVPITTAQSFRFSIWSDSDYDTPADFDGAGAIPPAAPGYSGYQEVQTVTPNANGFFQLQIGSVTPIPDFNITDHLFLQVEVKPAASANTAYEELDFDGIANATDRQPIGTIPYASNADFIDNAEIGTSAGDIAVLGPGGVFDPSVLPDGTNANSFTIDADDTGGDVILQFGTTLNKTLTWDNTNLEFDLSDDLNVTGSVTATGITSTGTIDFSTSTRFAPPSGAVAPITCTEGDIFYNTTSDELLVCTATNMFSPTGSFNKSMVYEPVYADSVVQPDGSNNNGTLDTFFVDTDGDPGNDNFNHYKWSTSKAVLHDNDIVIRFHIPEGFINFQAIPLQFTYMTDTALVADNSLDVTVEDTAGAAVTVIGGAALTSTTFTTANITFGGAPTFTPGESITIHIKLSAKSTGAAYASKLSLNYYGR